jgi:ribonucleoside-triphosphate reductase
MRKLDEIDNDLALAREELSNVKGTTAEVYSRIVGYYRSVRNWNKGKREEFKERRLYDIEASEPPLVTCASCVVSEAGAEPPKKMVEDFEPSKPHILLFVQDSCPACPDAKAAAGKLGIPVNTIDAASEAGIAEATRRNVRSTPTAILLNADGAELSRARNSYGIASLLRFVPDGELAEYKHAASM